MGSPARARRGTLTLECAPARASPNRDRRRIPPAVRHRGVTRNVIRNVTTIFPSLADEDQLAIERFDDDGDTTGPGLGPGGLLTACFTLLDAFQKWKRLRTQERPARPERKPCQRRWLNVRLLSVGWGQSRCRCARHFLGFFVANLLFFPQQPCFVSRCERCDKHESRNRATHARRNGRRVRMVRGATARGSAPQDSSEASEESDYTSKLQAGK